MAWTPKPPKRLTPPPADTSSTTSAQHSPPTDYDDEDETPGSLPPRTVMTIINTIDGASYTYTYSECTKRHADLGLVKWFTEGTTDTHVYTYNTGIQVFDRSKVVTIRVHDSPPAKK